MTLLARRSAGWCRCSGSAWSPRRSRTSPGSGRRGGSGRSSGRSSRWRRSLFAAGFAWVLLHQVPTGHAVPRRGADPSRRDGGPARRVLTGPDGASGVQDRRSSPDAFAISCRRDACRPVPGSDQTKSVAARRISPCPPPATRATPARQPRRDTVPPALIAHWRSARAAAAAGVADGGAAGGDRAAPGVRLRELPRPPGGDHLPRHRRRRRARADADRRREVAVLPDPRAGPRRAPGSSSRR